MQKRFSGFTLVEVIMAIVIIGVISVLALTALKPRTKMTSEFYGKAFDTLKLAAYNSYLEKHDEFGGTIAPDGTFTPDNQIFCNDLISFINTTENNCNGTLAPINGILNNLEPHFIATNGMSFWIAGNYTTGAITDSFGNDITRTFWVVFVDIDTQDETNSIDVDVVPFYVTNFGETIPAGEPLRNSEFLKTAVAVSQNVTDNGFTSNRTTRIPADNFIDAKRQAWGNTVWANDPLSFNLGKHLLARLQELANALGQQVDTPQWPELGLIGSVNNCRVTSTDSIDPAARAQTSDCQTCTYNCSIIVTNKKNRL